MHDLGKVLYILGCNEGPSKRYRVFNHIDYLKLHGVESEWIWDVHPEARNREFLSNFSIVVNFRGGYSDRVQAHFDLCRELGIPCVYDLDDLVFDASLADQIDAYRLMSDREKSDYKAGMESISMMVKSSDYLTTSTPFLRDYMERFSGKQTFIVPFGFNERQQKLASIPQHSSSPVRFIGYLSGTKTHEKDFSEAAAALSRILREYDDVFMKLVGPLDIDKHLPGMRAKIVQIPFVHWESLVFETSSLYATIAPFDPDSPFCQSKSDLKFVEPAICRVPTVASPISSFEAAIRHGENGLIARTEEDWYQALKSLLDDQEYRHRMADAAYNSVIQERSPERIGAVIIETYQRIVDLYHRKAGLGDIALSPTRKKADGLKIAWVIPQPFEASGGHRNIFRAIRYLSEFGHCCTLHMLTDDHRFSTGHEIRDFITREFFDIKADEVWHGVDNIAECDAMVCTYWTTAYVVKENLKKTKLPVYFLQDFEPMFFPMGTDYVRACETYRWDFFPLTSGPWPLRMLEDQFGVQRGAFFRFPLDRTIYHPSPDGLPKARKRVVYFARPDMPRRCYPLGVEALRMVKYTRPDVEIVFYGDDSKKFEHVPFEFVNVGKTKSIEDLGDLYRTAYLGVCFSTTNPSLVPFEMMACGCPVVDLDVNANEVSYGGRENCVLATPSPEAIAKAILELLDDEARHTKLVENGIRFASEFPTELEMANIIEGSIVDEFARVTAGADTQARRVGRL